MYIYKLLCINQRYNRNYTNIYSLVNIYIHFMQNISVFSRIHCISRGSAVLRPAETGKKTPDRRAGCAYYMSQTVYSVRSVWWFVRVKLLLIFFCRTDTILPVLVLEIPDGECQGNGDSDVDHRLPVEDCHQDDECSERYPEPPE